MHNIDNSIARARARGTYFYDIKFIRLKENSYNSQKFCTLKITRCTVFSTCIMHVYTLWSSAQKNLRANYLNNCIYN